MLAHRRRTALPPCGAAETRKAQPRPPPRSYEGNQAAVQGTIGETGARSAAALCAGTAGGKLQAPFDRLQAPTWQASVSPGVRGTWHGACAAPRLLGQQHSRASPPHLCVLVVSVQHLLPRHLWREVRHGARPKGELAAKPGCEGRQEI
jgi:hypothetical protein